MKKKIKNLANKVMKLHESTKGGDHKNGYKMFKEAMSSILTLEGDGVKSPLIKKMKAILSEYYNKYKTSIKKDPTRVIIEASDALTRHQKETLSKEDFEKWQNAEEKDVKEACKRIKEYHKQMTNASNLLKKAIDSCDFETAKFHADQVTKISSRISKESDYYIDDYLD